MHKLGYLVIGGAAGTLARHFATYWIHARMGPGFPYGTLAINLSGCFLIGLFATLAHVKFALGHEGQLLLMAGFCGAFTTFSAFMLETSTLLQAGQALKAFLNVLGSVALGFASLYLGALVGRRF